MPDTRTGASSTPRPEDQETNSDSTCSQGSCNSPSCTRCSRNSAVRNLNCEMSSLEVSDQTIQPTATQKSSMPQRSFEEECGILAGKLKIAIDKRCVNTMKMLIKLCDQKYFENVTLEVMEALEKHHVIELKGEAEEIMNEKQANQAQIRAQQAVAVAAVTPNKISLKAPRIEQALWNGDPIEFFGWFSRSLKLMEIREFDEYSAIEYLKAGLPDKERVYIEDEVTLEKLKEKLIRRNGNVQRYAKNIQNMFNDLPKCSCKSHFVDDLATAIEKLYVTIEIMKTHLPGKDIEETVYSTALNDIIVSKFPTFEIGRYNRESGRYIVAQGDIVAPKIIFKFIVEFIRETALYYNASSVDEFENDREFGVSVRAVQQDGHQGNRRQDGGQRSQNNNGNNYKAKCQLCLARNFDASHYPLSQMCEIKRSMGRDEIIACLNSLDACLLCLQVHGDPKDCQPRNNNGTYKHCRRRCYENNKPLNYKICNHDNNRSVKTNRTSSNHGLPLAENITIGSAVLGVQYDSGCGFSLIPNSSLRKINKQFYTRGRSKQIQIFAFSGRGKTISYTEIFLKIWGFQLKLHTFDEDLVGFPDLKPYIPKKWKKYFPGGKAEVPRKIDILIGWDNYGAFPVELDRLRSGCALFRSNLTGKHRLCGNVKLAGYSTDLNLASINRVTVFENKDLFNHLYAAEDYISPNLKIQLEELNKKTKMENLMKNTTVDTNTQTVSVKYSYKENLKQLGTNEKNCKARILNLHKKVSNLNNIAQKIDEHFLTEEKVGNYIREDPRKAEEDGFKIHFSAYNYVENRNSESTSVRIVMDSSMKTETGLSLNDVTCEPPGEINDMRGILTRSRTHKHFCSFDIKKFFRSVKISESDSYLRILMIPENGFSAEFDENTKWRYYRDTCVPFGDSPSCDYASTAKLAVHNAYILEVPEKIRDQVSSAIVNDMYVDDGSCGSDSVEQLLLMQHEITQLLKKGGFSVKIWEKSGEIGETKFLGVTWIKDQDKYKLKFRFNLSKRYRGMPSEEDLTMENMADKTNDITKKDVLGATCQYYDPAGLGTPLVFTLRTLYSKLCRDTTIKMKSLISAVDKKIFNQAVKEMIQAKNIIFPRQIIFNYEADLVGFFDGSLQGFGGCIYALSGGNSNLITSGCKIMGRSALTAVQSEMSAAALLVKMMTRLISDLSNVKVRSVKYVGDSEICLRMIAKNQASEYNIFYGTRVMLAMNYSTPDQWFWCKGEDNPADLLTRSGCTASLINTEFWKNGSFLTTPENSWPILPCSKLTNEANQLTSLKVVNIGDVEDNQNYIGEMLEKSKSYTGVRKCLLLLLKWARRHTQDTDDLSGWLTAETKVTRAILNTVQHENNIYLSKHKLANLATHQVDGIWYVADRSFRARIGVPLVSGKSQLARYIVEDAHRELGHARDILQIRAHIFLKFYIPGLRRIILEVRKSCPGCTRANLKQFQAFEADIPDNLKKLNPPFTFIQSDIFGPLTIYIDNKKEKRWILVTMCLTSRGVHLEELHSYASTSVSMGFVRTFAIRGTPKIVWIDAGINIVRSGRDITHENKYPFHDLNSKFSNIEFRSSPPKHHSGIGAVERMVGLIKNTISKSISDPTRVKMNQEEFNTWIAKVMQTANDRPLVLGLPEGLTITPNNVLLGFRENYSKIENSIPQPGISSQIQRWRNAMSIFYRYWDQEFAGRRYHVKGQKEFSPKVGDYVLFRNEPIYGHTHTIAVVDELIRRPNNDVYAAKITYKRNIKGGPRTVVRHLSDLSEFMDAELVEKWCNLPRMEDHQPIQHQNVAPEDEITNTERQTTSGQSAISDHHIQDEVFGDD